MRNVIHEFSGDVLDSASATPSAIMYAAKLADRRIIGVRLVELRASWTLVLLVRTLAEFSDQEIDRVVAAAKYAAPVGYTIAVVLDPVTPEEVLELKEIAKIAEGGDLSIEDTRDALERIRAISLAALSILETTNNGGNDAG